MESTPFLISGGEISSGPGIICGSFRASLIIIRKFEPRTKKAVAFISSKEKLFNQEKI